MRSKAYDAYQQAVVSYEAGDLVQAEQLLANAESLNIAKDQLLTFDIGLLQAGINAINEDYDKAYGFLINCTALYEDQFSEPEQQLYQERIDEVRRLQLVVSIKLNKFDEAFALIDAKNPVTGPWLFLMATTAYFQLIFRKVLRAVDISS